MEYISTTQGEIVTDLGICITILCKLHELKILMGNINRNNFLIRANAKWAMICDFASSELDAYNGTLKEEQGRLLISLKSNDFNEENDRWDIND